MASILSQLLKKQADIKEQIAANSLPLDELLVMQELNYRIGVLETFQSLVKTAPISTDISVLGQHYNIFDVSLRYLLKDHKFRLLPMKTEKRDARPQKRLLQMLFLPIRRNLPVSLLKRRISIKGIFQNVPIRYYQCGCSSEKPI